MSAQPHALSTATQLGLLLQTSRKARKLTQAALATQVGLSQSRVSHLEQHAGQMSLDQLLNWCAVLGLELTLGPRPERHDIMSATDW
jgi:HTH-type transcriptional regulator/antitoxin HipB